MSEKYLLSDAEIEERFHITGSRAIIFTLAGYIKDGEQFSALFGDELFVTTLLAVQPDQDRVIFDCSSAEALNQRLLRASRCRLAGRPGGVNVHFDAGAARKVEYDGRPAFAVALPKTIVRLQRRESFRIATPLVNPLRFVCWLPDGKELKLTAFDISVSGIGLLLTELPPGFEAGLILEKCRFRLPDDAQDLQLSAQVQHITATESRTGGRQWRAGVHFLNPSGNAEARLQRYIARLERERKERN